MSFTIHLLLVGILFLSMASSSVLQRPQNTNGNIPPDNITTVPVPPSLDLSWSRTAHTSRTANFYNSLLSTNSDVAPDPGGEYSLQTAAVKCDGSTYGFNLNRDSCKEAWDLLPKSTSRRFFGKRAEGHFNVPLPFRVPGCKHEVSVANLYLV